MESGGTTTGLTENQAETMPLEKNLKQSGSNNE